MIKRHEGIILKNYQPKKHKIGVFDKNLGRIECLAPYGADYIPVGTLIAYFPLNSRYLYDLEGLEVREVPLNLARYDFYFFHHILELSYYFLPLGSPAESIFVMVHFLLNSYDKISTDLQKKLFLLRFFVQLGIYPEEEFSLGDSFHYLLSQPIEVMLVQRVQIPEQALERWLFSCIETHPQKAKFKTMVVGCENGIF